MAVQVAARVSRNRPLRLMHDTVIPPLRDWPRPRLRAALVSLATLSAPPHLPTLERLRRDDTMITTNYSRHSCVKTAIASASSRHILLLSQSGDNADRRVEGLCEHVPSGHRANKSWVKERFMHESSLLVPRMAVYYPYIHIRDERWLKVAALYWPRMVRIVSPDYPTRNSQLVDILADELGFIIDHPPDDAARDVAAPFAAFVEGLGPEAMRRLKVKQGSELLSPERLTLPHPPAAFSATDSTADETCVPAFEYYSPAWSSGNIARDTAGVHQSEVAPTLADRLIDAGLAVHARGEWLAMNPALAWLYKCRLTEELAVRNNLVPATDQLPAHAVMAGPVNIASLTGQTARARKSVGFQAAFGLLSIDAVIPRNLDLVPPAKIVEIRRRFSAQFDRWREYADQVAAGLATQLQDVESPELLKAYLDDAVKRYASGPVDDLKRGLAAVGIDAVTTAVNTKFGVPAAALAGLTTPQIAAVGGMALAVANLRRSTRHKAQAQQDAPVAYLLSVRETLAPTTWLSRILTIMRRATGLRD
jgi:Family of unknown function (DUF6236)